MLPKKSDIWPKAGVHKAGVHKAGVHKTGGHAFASL